MKANKTTATLSKLYYLSVITILIFFVQGCCFIFPGKCKRNNRSEIQAPIAINILDGNGLFGTQIQSSKITLIDDGGKVATPNNLSFSTLNVNGGVLSIGLKKNAKFSINNPYRFALKIESSGYSTNYRTIVVSKDTAQYIPIFMTKIDDPPPGTSTNAGAISIRNSTITDAVTIVPKISNEQKGKVSLSFAKGTVLKSYGKKINENALNISYNFSYASPNNLATLRTFPGGTGGTLISDAIDKNGKTIATPANPVFFTSAGWMTLEMSTRDQTVTEFSNAAVLTMPIDDSLINPVTLKPYKENDSIEFWSLDERSVWKNEGIAVVKPSNDGLIAKMNIRHLSTWNLDYHGTDVCASTPISYCNKRSGTGTTIPLWCEIYQTEPGSAGTRFTSCGAGGKQMDFKVCPTTPPCTQCTGDAGTPEPPGASDSHTILNGFKDKQAAFVVYNSTSGPPSTSTTGPPSTTGILASSIFTFCGADAPPTLIIPSGGLQSVKIMLQIKKSETGMPSPITNNAVFFNSTGCSTGSPVAYNYGGNLVAGVTSLYSPGNFAITDIRIVDGSIVNSTTGLYSYDFQLDLGSQNPVVQSTSLRKDCMVDSRSVDYRWDPANNYFQITINDY